MTRGAQTQAVRVQPWKVLADIKFCLFSKDLLARTSVPKRTPGFSARLPSLSAGAQLELLGDEAARGFGAWDWTCGGRGTAGHRDGGCS